jgi:hypothetical protein
MAGIVNKNPRRRAKPKKPSPRLAEEARHRLGIIENKTKEGQALRQDIQALRSEGIKRVARIMDGLGNKE